MVAFGYLLLDSSRLKLFPTHVISFGVYHRKNLRGGFVSHSYTARYFEQTTNTFQWSSVSRKGIEQFKDKCKNVKLGL